MRVCVCLGIRKDGGGGGDGYKIDFTKIIPRTVSCSFSFQKVRTGKKNNRISFLGKGEEGTKDYYMLQIIIWGIEKVIEIQRKENNFTENISSKA